MPRLFVVVIAVFTLAALCPAASAASAPYCRPGEVPEFRFGFAELKAQLRVGMGDPIECEHATGVGGNTWMKTTTGLAFYHQSTSTSSVIVVISGETYHWALTANGLAFWQADVTESADPPESATIVSDAICRLDADSTPAFHPLRSACFALYVTALGDPFTPQASLPLAPVLAPPPVAPVAPVTGARTSTTADSSPIILRSPPSDDQLLFGVSHIDARLSSSFPTVEGQVCNQTRDWTATDIALTFAFYDRSGFETLDTGRFSIDAVVPGECRSFRTGLTDLMPWSSIGVGRGTWTWTS